MVCADTEVTGTEIKIEAAIKAATDTPQFLAFACAIVCSFLNSETTKSRLDSRATMAANDHASLVLSVKIVCDCCDVRRSAGCTAFAARKAGVVLRIYLPKLELRNDI